MHRTVVSSGTTLRLRSATTLSCAYVLARAACYHNAREGFATPFPEARAHTLHILPKPRHALPIALRQVRRTHLSAPGTYLNQAKRTKRKPCTNCKNMQLPEGGILVELLLVGRLTTVKRAQTASLLPVSSCTLLWNSTMILQCVPCSSNCQRHIHILIAPIANTNSSFPLLCKLKHLRDRAGADKMRLSCEGAPNCCSQWHNASPSQRHPFISRIRPGQSSVLSQRQRRLCHTVAGTPRIHTAHPHET